MVDSYNPLIKAIIAKLIASTPVMAYVAARVYSHVPQNTAFPYIRVEIKSAPFDSCDTTGMEHTVTVQCFSRKATPDEAASIRSAVYALLHRNEAAFSLDSGTLFHLIYDGIGFVEQEPDGKTWQGMAQFKAVVMD